MSKEAQVNLSIIIPVYNSADIFPELYRRLVAVLDHAVESFEVITVLDGCADNSFEVISEYVRKDKRFKLIEFSRNFGHQTAISAGLKHSKGETIAIMDDDLQDPPEILPKFIEKLNEGFEVVYGIRRRRKENILKRAEFYLFYRIINLLCKQKIPHDSGDFCVMKRNIVNHINQFDETNKFLRGIRNLIGFRQTGIEYERDLRYAGSSQYTLRKYFGFAMDAILSFSYVPLRIATICGFLVALMSFCYGFYVMLLKIYGYTEDFPGFAALFVAITFLGGVILICLGIIGEYIARIYDEVKKRPEYIIKNKLGFDA